MKKNPETSSKTDLTEAFFRVRPPEVRSVLAEARGILLEPQFALEECWKWQTVFYRRERDLCYLLVREAGLLIGFLSGDVLERSGFSSLLHGEGQKTVRHFLFVSSVESAPHLRKLISAVLEISDPAYRRQSGSAKRRKGV